MGFAVLELEQQKIEMGQETLNQSSGWQKSSTNYQS
jgi:hypothetical protein